MSALQLEALNFNANHPLLVPDTVWSPLNCMYLALGFKRYADCAPHNQGLLVEEQDHARVYRVPNYYGTSLAAQVLLRLLISL